MDFAQILPEASSGIDLFQSGSSGSDLMHN